MRNGYMDVIKYIILRLSFRIGRSNRAASRDLDKHLKEWYKDLSSY